MDCANSSAAPSTQDAIIEKCTEALRKAGLQIVEHETTRRSPGREGRHRGRSAVSSNGIPLSTERLRWGCPRTDGDPQRHRWGIRGAGTRARGGAREEGRKEGERKGEQKGEQEGLREALRLVIRSRFGAAGDDLIARLDAVCDPDRLRSLLEAVGHAERIEDFRSLLEAS